MARSKKIELDMIALENVKLKEQLSKTYQLPPTHDVSNMKKINIPSYNLFHYLQLHNI